jgi:hypothetical protein
MFDYPVNYAILPRFSNPVTRSPPAASGMGPRILQSASPTVC